MKLTILNGQNIFEIVVYDTPDMVAIRSTDAKMRMQRCVEIPADILQLVVDKLTLIVQLKKMEP